MSSTPESLPHAFLKMHRAKSRHSKLQSVSDGAPPESAGYAWPLDAADQAAGAVVAAAALGAGVSSSSGAAVAASVTLTLSPAAAALASRPTVGSIYDLYSPQRKAVLLLLVCVMSVIVPLSDTVYLPSLERVKADLRCSQALAALTVAVYMAGAGCMALVWGPLADRFGRRRCYFSCSVAYIAATLGCMLAASISQLVAARALQGGAVSGFMAGGAGVVADVFPPRQRGLASGIFSVPMLIGPILGPLIGGATAAAYGWRSCFVVLAAFAGAALALVAFLLPQETHQFFTVERTQALLGIPATRTFIEAPQILANRPRFRPPWRPLGLLLERSVLPFCTVKFVLFGCMFASLITLPQQLAKRQRQASLSEHLAGLAYVPVAVGCFVAAPLGGKAADVAATRLLPCKQGRLVPALAASGLLMPCGLVGFGWGLSLQSHLALVLLAHAAVGAAVGVYMPALFSFLSVEKQAQASAAASAVQSANMVVAAVFIQTSALAVERLGAGPFFSLLAGLSFAAVLGVGAYTASVLRQSRRQAPAAVLGDQGAGGGPDCAAVELPPRQPLPVAVAQQGAQLQQAAML